MLLYINEVFIRVAIKIIILRCKIINERVSDGILKNRFSKIYFLTVFRRRKHFLTSFLSGVIFYSYLVSKKFMKHRVSDTGRKRLSSRMMNHRENLQEDNSGCINPCHPCENSAASLQASR